MSTKVVVIVWAAICLLNAVCVWLWFQRQHQRFTHIRATNATVFIMFDQKTAQACWAGPPGLHVIESPDGKQRQAANEAGVPFCKDLK
jgi:hypothetical protein